uniref:Uncharacterized protein n=1 Tax=Mesostigma viride TaxID=41882 RepID=Q8W9P8_MESVI|nr:hypothetical protein MeviPp40 [Mesostigma viride]AAL36760.1 hypothetical protein [Mesostigma viride]
MSKKALKEKKQYANAACSERSRSSNRQPYVLILAKTEVKNADKIKNEFPNIKIQNFIKDNFFLRQGPTLFLGLSSLEEVTNFIKYLKHNSMMGLALLKNSTDAYLLEDVEELEKKKLLGKRDIMIYFFALSVRRKLFSIFAERIFLFQKSLKFFLFLYIRSTFQPKVLQKKINI